MSEPLNWHDEADILGVLVRAWFFDPAEVATLADPVAQLLPILAAAPPVPLGQRSSHSVGGLVAQPDAVLRHGNGLLCVMHKSADPRPHDRDAWRGQLRVDVVLQAIAHAMAVAGERQLPTLALWRGANVLYQFDPSPPVLECLATHIGAARHYWNEPVSINPAQLASFCEPRLRALPGLAQGAAASLAA